MRRAEQIFIVKDLGVLLLEADQQLFSLALVALQFTVDCSTICVVSDGGSTVRDDDLIVKYDGCMFSER